MLGYRYNISENPLTHWLIQKHEHLKVIESPCVGRIEQALIHIWRYSRIAFRNNIHNTLSGHLHQDWQTLVWLCQRTQLQYFICLWWLYPLLFHVSGAYHQANMLTITLCPMPTPWCSPRFVNERPQSWDHVQCKDRKVSLSPAATQGNERNCGLQSWLRMPHIFQGTTSSSEMLGVRIVPERANNLYMLGVA